MHRAVTLAALLLATASSVATSQAIVRWSAVGHDKLVETLDRDTDAMGFAVDVFANETLMRMPTAPPVAPEPSRDPVRDTPAGTGLRRVEPADREPFSSNLVIDVELATKGVLGIDANETDAMVTLLDADGGVLATDTVAVEPFEPSLVTLELDGALVDCELDVACERSFEVWVETTESSKVRVKLEAWVRLQGPMGVRPPDDAELEVELSVL